MKRHFVEKKCNVFLLLYVDSFAIHSNDEYGNETGGDMSLSELLLVGLSDYLCELCPQGWRVAF